MLNFASVPVGATARKTINLTNSYGFPVSVLIRVEGLVVKFLEFENNFRIEDNSSKEIEIIARPTESGFYEGVLIVYFKR